VHVNSICAGQIDYSRLARFFVFPEAFGTVGVAAFLLVLALVVGFASFPSPPMEILFLLPHLPLCISIRRATNLSISSRNMTGAENLRTAIHSVKFNGVIWKMVAIMST